MRERKDVPTGIVCFILFIIVLNIVFLAYLMYQVVFAPDFLLELLTVSILSIIGWMAMILATLSLLLIPYGFLKRRQGARIFAVVYLVLSTFSVIAYIAMTGEKIIGFLLFALFIISIMYLLMTPVKSYFGKIPQAMVPCESVKEYTYGLYTLYSRVVRLKNGKNQRIYFFSKRRPKSGSPSIFPGGFEVDVSDRSGLPYLRKRRTNPNIS